MTGQKDRYTTSEKMWRLSDETLTTPKHDEMVIWLLNPNNIISLFGVEYDEIYTRMGLKIKYEHPDYGIVTFSVKDHLNTAENEIFIQCLNYENVKCVDVLSKLKIPASIIKHWSEIQNEHEKNKEDFNNHIVIKSEVPLFGGNKFIIGYVDIIVGFKNKITKTDHLNIMFEYEAIPKKYIEVKTNIKSFGQTLRQLRTYESFLPENKQRHATNNVQMCLFTADSTFKKAFESQGIEVLIYPNK